MVSWRDPAWRDAAKVGRTSKINLAVFSKPIVRAQRPSHREMPPDPPKARETGRALNFPSRPQYSAAFPSVSPLLLGCHCLSDETTPVKVSRNFPAHFRV